MLTGLYTTSLTQILQKCKNIHYKTNKDEKHKVVNKFSEIKIPNPTL